MEFVEAFSAFGLITDLEPSNMVECLENLLIFFNSEIFDNFAFVLRQILNK